MLLNYAISAVITLFVVVDPVAMAPTFLAVTAGMPRTFRKSVAVRASIIAGAILVGAALIGDRLLNVLEISLPAFRIAGGLLLFWIAAEMVFGVRTRTRVKPRNRRSKSASATSRPSRWRSPCSQGRAQSRRPYCSPGKPVDTCCCSRS